MLKKIKNYFRTIKKRQYYLQKTSFLRTYKGKDKTIFLMLTPEYGNVGDHLIAYNELQFLLETFPMIKIIEVSMNHFLNDKQGVLNIIDKKDLVIVTGGGFVGNTWITNSQCIDDIVSGLPDNPIIILPQTVFFDNDDPYFSSWKMIYENHSQLTFFVREYNSYKFLVDNTKIHPLFCYDFGLLGMQMCDVEKNKVILCLRDDKEKVLNSNTIREVLAMKNINSEDVSTILQPEELIIEHREFVLKKYFNIFSSAKLVITDRLHGMILAIITGSACIAFDNTTGKISGVYDTLVNKRKVKLVRDATDFDNILEEMINTNNVSEYSDDNSEVVIKKEKYDLIREEIMKWLE